jgi:hypothetical protein
MPHYILDYSKNQIPFLNQIWGLVSRSHGGKVSLVNPEKWFSARNINE